MKQKLLSIFLLCTLFVGVAFAQNRQVSGKVTSSADGSPVVGVTVLTKGTSNATQTNNDGSYSISTPEGSTLVFRHIGHVEKSLKVSSNTLNVVLESNDSSIEDVVVIGYGSGTAIGTAVSSKTTITSKDIEGRPNANALEALQGRVPGLTVLTSNGEPSATQSIRLHGSGSLGASSTPLFVVDGIPTGSGSIVSTNPDDWESITVLKDATATSIYGSRAANGVIYFTSKKGKVGERAVITTRAMKGINNLATTKHLDAMMNTAELQNFWLETGYQTQAQIDAINKVYGGNDTQWGKYYYKENTGIDQYDLSISGGSPKTQYYLSSSYYDQEGIMYRSNFERITLRSNITSKLNDWMKVGLNLYGGYDTRQSNGYGSNNTNGGLSLMALPWYTPYDKDGNEYYETQIPGLGRYTPKYLADKLPAVGKNKQFNPSFYIEVTPYKGVTLKSQAGMDYYDYRNSSNRMPSYASNLNNGSATEGYDQAWTKTMTNTIDYRTKFNLKHDFSILFGQESTDYDQSGFTASGEGLSDDRLILLGNTIPAGRGISSTKSEYAYNSWFGRTGYSYDAKYYVDFTLRNDASSKFGKDNRNATFWAVGGMWNAKREQFLNNVDWLTDLKIKASIGTQGNSSIDLYKALATVGNVNYDSKPGWGVNAAGNPLLGWEQQTKTTIGVSASFFDRVNLEVEVYNRITDNMLVAVPYAYTTGFADVTSNVGSLRNNGIDVDFSYNVFKSPDYFFTPFVNFNYNSQQIKELFQGNEYWIVPNTGVSWAVGSAVEYFYPVQAGVDPQTGLMQWYVPGDNIAVPNFDPNNVSTTFNPGVLQQSTGKKRHAPFVGGFGFTGGYKGFSVEAAFTFAQGKYMINNDKYFFANSYGFRGNNQMKEVQDYWKKPGDETKYPKYGQTNQFDSGLIENASFLRLKSLRVVYSVPKNVLARQKFFSNAKVFYTGRNLWTTTKYLGPDPEVDSNLALGVNPNTKQSSFGIELQF